MQKKTRSLLEELDTLRLHKDRENLVESRASHVIQGAINLKPFERGIAALISLLEQEVQKQKNLSVPLKRSAK